MNRIFSRKHRKHQNINKKHANNKADFFDVSEQSLYSVKPPHVADWPEKMTQAVGSTTSIILHTVAFVVAFVLPFFGIDFDRVLLVLTTIVSLEAIYLALFIQMTVNRNTKSLAVVEEEIDEIQEDMADISDEIEDIGEDIDEIQEDVEEITEDIEEMTDDKEISKQ